MFDHQRRLRLVLLLGATLASSILPLSVSPARAQTTETPAAQTPATAASSVKDEAAKQILQNMIAAHRALKSYSAMVDTEQRMDGKVMQTLRSNVRWQRPNRVAISTTSTGTEKGTVRAVANGQFVFMQISSQANQYLKRTIPADADTILDVLGAGGLSGAGAGLVFGRGGSETLERFLGAAASYEVQPEMTISGVLCDVVKAQVPNERLGTVTFTLAMGKEDRLLRRHHIEASTPRGIMVLIETFSNVQTNPVLAAATWTFTPPRGAKAVDVLEPPTYDTRLKVGAKPFAIQAKDLSGKPLSLEQFKGKVLLLDFWASWCVPCVAEMPAVVKAHQQFKAKGFEVVGISLDEDRAAMTRFQRSFKMPWRQVFDGKGWESEVAQKYGVKAIPFTLLIGRDGKIAAVNLRGEALTPAIRQALAKKP